MKKIINSVSFIILATLIMCSCNSHEPIVAIQPINCGVCDDPRAGAHDIEPASAAALIKEFEDNFDVSAYGGTFWADQNGENYFKNIPDATTGAYPVIKFHFITDSQTSNNLSIAVEKEECKGTMNPVGNYCLKSSDKKFKKVSWWPPWQDFDERLQKQKRFDDDDNKPENQKIFKSDVEKGIENVKNNDKFKGFLCPLAQANFNFASSIHDLYEKSVSSNNKKIAGIRYYFGLRDAKTNYMDATEIDIILVGVDEEGENMNLWRENSLNNLISREIK